MARLASAAHSKLMMEFPASPQKIYRRAAI
jgi:hypothetical protein